MSLSQQEWRELVELEGLALKERVFALIQEASLQIQLRETDDPELLSVIPRLADLIDAKPELASFRELASSLARWLGLWNYIDKEIADERDLILADAVSSDELGGLTLHREQIAALNILLSGRNLVLSAPTSFGKSLLIDALLATGKYHRVAIVVPTIALLDEFRRRLLARFASRYKLVMYHSDDGTEGDVIFLGTQERLIGRDDLRNLDLAVVDEFYKLDPARRDERSLTLNAAVYQLLKRARQFFFLGPNIQNVQFSSDSHWRFEFLRTRFSTVAVDTFDLRGIPNKETRLEQELANKDNWPCLIFVSGPERANQLANRLAATGISYGAGIQFAQWIEANFGGTWDLSTAVSAGIGIHHGRIPRAVASHFVRLFNSGDLPILICTSTLIEGVNTAAKSVMIYDKTINREDFDFFTFSNIRGRAGRLGQHHIGNVYLFHSPPEHEDVEVSAPLFGDLDDAPDDLVVHITDEDTSPKLDARIQEIAQRLQLDGPDLRLAASIGVENSFALKQYTEMALKQGERLQWRGWPDYRDFLAVCKVVCRLRPAPSFGAWSPEQLAFFLTRLRSIGTMSAFFQWYSNNYKGKSTNQDNVFKFLRSCEYGLPQLFALVALFVRRAKGNADYGLVVADLPRWFKPEILKNLDEQGVPIQISERFWAKNDTLLSLSSRLRIAAERGDSRLSEFERKWITEAVPTRLTRT